VKREVYAKGHPGAAAAWAILVLVEALAVQAKRASDAETQPWVVFCGM